MSQEEFANKIGYSRIQLSRFETGQVLPDNDTLRKIARLTNTHPAYLKGDTDIKDYSAYLLEDETAAMEGLSEYEKSIQIEISKKQTFFELCGVQYQNVDSEDFYIVDEFRPHRVYNGPHELTIPECGGKVYLSDEDLQTLFTLMHDVISFECFRLKERRSQ